MQLMDLLKHEFEEEQEVVILSSIVLLDHKFMIINTEIVDSLYRGKILLRFASLVPPEQCLPALDDDLGKINYSLILTDLVALVPGAVYEHNLIVRKGLFLLLIDISSTVFKCFQSFAVFTRKHQESFLLKINNSC